MPILTCALCYTPDGCGHLPTCPAITTATTTTYEAWSPDGKEAVKVPFPLRPDQLVDED